MIKTKIKVPKNIRVLAKALEEPIKKHGLTLMRLSRRPFDFAGFEHGGQYRYCDTSAGRPSNEEMFAEAAITTKNFSDQIHIKLTDAEVKAINKIETGIAARLAREVAEEGR